MIERRCREIGVLSLILSMTLLFSLSGCEADYDFAKGEDTVLLRVHILGEGEVDPLEGEFERGVSLSISAKAHEGWRFYRWEGGVTQKAEPYTSVFMDTDRDLTAIFIEEENEHGFSGWEGTVEKPFLIKNEEEFDRMREYLHRHFVLIGDLNLYSYEEWTPIGYSISKEGQREYTPFTGSLDGRDYVIENLTIDKRGEESIGLFSILKGAMIKNVRIEEATIQGGSHVGVLAGRTVFHEGGWISNCHGIGVVEGEVAIGGLVGLHQGEIRDSSFQGLVQGREVIGGLVGLLQQEESMIDGSYTEDASVIGEREVGGLVGKSEGVIQKSHSKACVEGEISIGGLVGVLRGSISLSYATGEVTGVQILGGLVGSHREGATIRDSYARGDVKSSDGHTLGGLIGEVSGELRRIERTYATGRVEGLYVTGGLIGSLHGHTGDMIFCSYYDRVTTGQDDDEGKGLPRTTEEMMESFTYTDWDFDSIWVIEEEESYPFFSHDSFR